MANEKEIIINITTQSLKGKITNRKLKYFFDNSGNLKVSNSGKRIALTIRMHEINHFVNRDIVNKLILMNWLKSHNVLLQEDEAKDIYIDIAMPIFFAFGEEFNPVKIIRKYPINTSVV